MTAMWIITTDASSHNNALVMQYLDDCKNMFLLYFNFLSSTFSCNQMLKLLIGASKLEAFFALCKLLKAADISVLRWYLLAELIFTPSKYSLSFYLALWRLVMGLKQDP